MKGGRERGEGGRERERGSERGGGKKTERKDENRKKIFFGTIAQVGPRPPHC